MRLDIPMEGGGYQCILTCDTCQEGHISVGLIADFGVMLQDLNTEKQMKGIS